MKKIKIIPYGSVLKEDMGNKSFNTLLYVVLPLFIVVFTFLLYNGIKRNNFEDIIMSIFGLILFGGVGIFAYFKMLKGGDYVPGKSYSEFRQNKKSINNKIAISFLIILLINIIGFIYNKNNYFSYWLGPSIATLYGLFHYRKSVKFHEDIDYESNEFISDLIGVSINEKITASYQNFDSTKDKSKKNDNLIVVTNRKIFFAFFNGTNWMTLNKLFSEIEKIGIVQNEYNSYLKLIFSDKTSLGLKLELYEKITTTPQLFIKQFLSTLDASLMGYDVVGSNNRRRVSIFHDNESITHNSRNQKRSIELNPTLVNELKTSEEIKSGRILEI
jgi:hypothetical protein